MCPVLEDPDNGEVFVQCRVVGCFAAYSCNPGFGICEGDLVVRVCGDDGEWIGDAPTCKMRKSSIAIHVHVRNYYYCVRVYNNYMQSVTVCTCT